MLLRNHPNRIRIVFDDHRLVANAGLCQYVVVQRFRPLKRACLRSIGQDEYRYQDSIHLQKVAGRQHNTVFMSTHNPNIFMALDF